jgi:hypothetical protein
MRAHHDDRVGYDVTQCIDDQPDSQRCKEYRDDCVNGVFQEFDESNETAQGPTERDRLT